jgi:hypothetical protein
MNGKEPKKDPDRPQPKPWVKPQLRALGSMRDKILGAGKAGSNLDGDPSGTFKPGVG